MKLKISIVVPVYMVEKYIEKCVHSLINQTYKDIEIILVNDGSPDNCSSICDKYKEIDERVYVIHKVNGGLSDARNVGLMQATGDYILFVDSDDYIDIDTCERFISIINSREEVDIVVGNARRIEGFHTTIMYHSYDQHWNVLTGTQYLMNELKANTMYMAAWLSLYNRNFLLKNNLVFKVGLLHEDEQFTPRAFLAAKKIIGTDIIFYNYQIREGSITTTKNKIINAEHMMKTCKELEVIYSNLNNNELIKLLNDNLVNRFLNTFQVAGLHRKRYSYLVDKSFLRKKAYTKKNKLRVTLFLFNKKLYYYLNNFKKVMK